MKTVKAILSEEAGQVFKYLNEQSSNSKIENSILKSITYKIELIKDNFHYGQPIAKNKIPQKYIEKYDIDKLFWVQLPNFWRMLYTLKEGENKIEIIAFIIDIINHKEYDKIFGYN